MYIAGKVSSNSEFGTHYWRDSFCEFLSKRTGIEIINLDPTKISENLKLEGNNSKLIFGRDCYMIKSADLVIVNLTDDISVGGSQEMLIAKYFSKPLVGIAPKDGKFNKNKKTYLEKTYKDWLHPFVEVPCDKIVDNIEELSVCIKDLILKPVNKIKGISVIDEMIDYYEEKYYDQDDFFNN